MFDGIFAGLTPAFRHLTGENVNICRLCFDAVESGVNLQESRLVECFYYDGTVTFTDMLTELRISTEPSLPQLLCEVCANLTIQAFFFAKLSQHSDNKWHDAVDRLNQAVKMAEKRVKTARNGYLLIQEQSNKVIRGRNWKTIQKNKLPKRVVKHLQRKSNNINTTKQAGLSVMVCDQCGDKVKINHLSYHMRKKHNNNKYPCQTCSKLFVDANKLRIHEERKHRPKTSRCPHCGKLGSKLSIKKHISNYHIEDTCKVCFMRVPSKVALRVHSYQHKLLLCNHCYKIFQNQETLNLHSKTCEDYPEMITCDICKKHFYDRPSLMSHLASHGYRNFHPCKWCGKKLQSASKLKSHIVKHTQERNFSCDQCGGVFVTKEALVVHIRLHTGEKPYPCEMCGQRFLSTSRRMDHVRRIHKPPQHVCSLCDSKFRSKRCLRKHYICHRNPKSKLYVSELLSEA